MPHVITNSNDDGFKARCSCGWHVECGLQKYRDTQVSNHSAFVTGVREVFCHTCRAFMGAMIDGGLVCGPLHCKDCTSHVSKDRVQVRYGN